MRPLRMNVAEEEALSAIRADFNTLYQAVNGMELLERDKSIYPVCTLCRDHEKAGFVDGIKVGVLLQSELSEK